MSLFSEPDTSLYSSPTTVNEGYLFSNPTMVDESTRHHAFPSDRSDRSSDVDRMLLRTLLALPNLDYNAWSEWEVPSLGSCWPTDDPLQLEVAQIIDAPLADQERLELNWKIEELRRPGNRYAYEYCIEKHRISRIFQTSKAKMNPRVTLLGLQEEREPIFIRHRIRKRWQELGIWNPAWDVAFLPCFEGPDPCRISTPAEWEWEWESEKRRRPGPWVKHRDQASDAPFNLSISPAKVAEGASMREAEAFIVSRPWLVYEMHKAENKIRFKRIPPSLLWRLDTWFFPEGQERRVWKERGEWNDSWDEPGIKEQSIQPGWTWRDESPEPELDDILQFDTADLDPCDLLEWEAIPLPSLSTMTWPPYRVLGNPTIRFCTPWTVGSSMSAISHALDRDDEKRDGEPSDHELEAGVADITATNQGPPTFASVPICSTPVPRVLSGLILSPPPGDELEATASAATPPDRATASLAPRDAICVPPVPGTSGVLFVSALSKDDLRSLFSSQPIQDELEAGPVGVTPDSAAASSPPAEAIMVPHVSSSPSALQVSALSKAQLESLFPLGGRREAGPADGSSPTKDKIPAPDIFILSRITKEQLQLLF